jgi:SAM-dependent methyltransferase
MLFLSSDMDVEQDRLIGDFRGYIKDHTIKSAASLEIGPGYNPILPKREGYAVQIVDHANQQSLQRKYKALGVDTSLIEPVDHVWAGERLPNLLKHQTFGVIVASHLIEHQPDLIAFLQNCGALLQPNGTLFLLVPDLRYCFDYFQTRTDVASLLCLYQRNVIYHSFEAHYRNVMNISASHEGSPSMIAWYQKPLKDIQFMNGDPLKAFQNAVENTRRAYYTDTHAYYFTPISFLLILNELSYLNFLDLHVSLLTRARGCEFLCVLQQGAPTYPNLQSYLETKQDLCLRLMDEDRERLALAPQLSPKQACS